MRHLCRLYPRRWRRRYGAELEALIEELPTTPGNLVDVAAGAVKAHLAESRRYAEGLAFLVGMILIFQLLQLILLMGGFLVLSTSGHFPNFDLAVGRLDFYYARSSGLTFQVGMGAGTAAISTLLALVAVPFRARLTS